MINPTKTFDGDLEIIFSNSCLVYKNKLTIAGIEGRTIEINFVQDAGETGYPLKRISDSTGGILIQKIVLRATNWNNTLGITSAIPILLFSNSVGKILLSLRTQKVTDAAMMVTVTIYKGQ